MTILVTGATGGFGKYLMQWLQMYKKETIIAMGRSVSDQKNYICCDLQDIETLNKCIIDMKPRIIYHLAASFTDHYETDYTINTLVAQQILEIFRKNKLETRLVLIGSASEYGLIRSEDNPIQENHPLCPISIYGLTKAFQTQYALCYTYKYKFNVVIARIFNLFAQGLSERLFLGRLEKQINSYLQGEIKEIKVGNLHSYRDYINVNEAIYQLNIIAEKGYAGEVYHVASGKPKLMRNLLKELLNDFHLDFSIVKEGCHVPGKLNNDIPIIYADMSKTNKLIGING
ncbi:MAG: GDP-mannose 4,6-dehydratase [Alphaproteobacteria bacterium]|nr:GDP-mannose 4,6-dehydratase [Alphaproteobacteria bacterium]